MSTASRLLTRFALLLAAACGGDGDGDAEPGTELGACVLDQFCESPLQCVDEICVNPDQIGGTGDDIDASDPVADDGAPPPSDNGSQQGGGDETGDGGPAPSTTGPDDGGAEIYCGTYGHYCFCSHDADYGPPDAACSDGTVAPPGLCCANEGWPGYGTCTCSTVSCRQQSDSTCVCDTGMPDPEDAVGSCALPDEGGACCLDEGGGCTCSTVFLAGQCPENQTSVGSCSVASVGCGVDDVVTACNTD